MEYSKFTTKVGIITVIFAIVGYAITWLWDQSIIDTEVGVNFGSIGLFMVFIVIGFFGMVALIANAFLKLLAKRN